VKTPPAFDAHASQRAARSWSPSWIATPAALINHAVRIITTLRATSGIVARSSLRAPS
jgi:hypothetical protein